MVKRSQFIITPVLMIVIHQPVCKSSSFIVLPSPSVYFSATSSSSSSLCDLFRGGVCSPPRVILCRLYVTCRSTTSPARRISSIYGPRMRHGSIQQSTLTPI
ncbi:unnamed protein product [Danaus chrysippus]|uniref:(African queen) hypothetical protein n=1 Tax=Danaus chrysippus TaxID=151541 RepID=A0A8J2QPD6_9NEOP|nr:unnamed protein product [Danaus chrysippus]